MSKNLDETAIRLHTDSSGNVWYGRGLEAPQNSAKSVDLFTLSPMCSGTSSVFRILGVARNADLICTMFPRMRQKEIRAIEIAGPNVISDYTDLNAQQIVMRMSGVRTAPSCGGWRQMSGVDYSMYALISRFVKNGFVLDGPAYIHFGSHPIAKIMEFVPTLSKSDAACVAAMLVDPRWFVDRRNYETTQNVFCFLGLTPAVQNRVSNKTCILSRIRELRCARVLAAWKSRDIPPEKIDLQNPANFLYRIWHAAGGGAKGDLRASQAFVRYIVANWLSATERRKGARDGLFAADLYFKTAEEQQAYKEYAASVAN